MSNSSLVKIKESELPWVEKYRPDTVVNIISHKDILNILKKLIVKGNFPHVIFYGPPGTGKTTTILACAKQMYGESYTNMVLELNGSDDRGINVVREQIKDFSQSEMFNNDIFNINKKKHKLVILDEADSMTYDAQFALRRVIESYTATTRFCLICNYSTKIIQPLQSRCIIFRFSPIPFEDHFNHIKKIVKLEKMSMDDEVLREIILLSEGDMRKSLNVLQSLFMTCGSNHINLDMLYINLGYPKLSEKKEITDSIINNNIGVAYSTIKQLELTKSFSLNDILNQLTLHVIQDTTINSIKKAKIIKNFAQIEYFLAGNINTSIQLGAIIAALKYPN